MRLFPIFLMTAVAAAQDPLSFVFHDDPNGYSLTRASKILLSPGLDPAILGFSSAYNPFFPFVGSPLPQTYLRWGGSILHFSTSQVRWGGNTIPIDATVDKNGYIWLVGYTDSDDFPLVKPFPSQKLPYRKLSFVMKLNQIATSVVFASFIGAYDEDVSGMPGTKVTAIATDGAGNAYVLGTTFESRFPTTLPGFGIRTINYADRQEQAFLLKIDGATSNLIFSELIGADSCTGICYGDTYRVTATSLAVDEAGAATIAGDTNAVNFPVTAGSFQSAPSCPNCSSFGFVSRISADGKTMLWSTYFGGLSQSDYTFRGKAVNWLKLDAAGNAYLSGSTFGGFPTTEGVLQPSRPGKSDQVQPYVAKLDSAGKKLLWGTYLGGSAGAQIHGLALNPSGGLYVTGTTNSTDFPSLPDVPDLGPDFVAGLNANGTALDRYFRLPRDTTSVPPVLDAQGKLLLLSGTGSLIRMDPATALKTPAVFALTNAAIPTPDTGMNGGELVTLFGYGLGPAKAMYGQLDANGKLPTLLGGIQVLFGLIPSPLLSVSANRITFQKPVGPGNVSHNDYNRLWVGDFKVIVDGHTVFSRSNEEWAFIRSAVAIFQSEPGWAAAVNEDGTPNGPTNPAAPRSMVSIYVNGADVYLGGDRYCSDQGDIGSLARTALDLDRRIALYSGNFPLPVTYIGPAPGLLNGICQINFRLPSGQDPQITITGGLGRDPVRIHMR